MGPRLLKFVSVGLKEASLDSPSFRASTNCSDKQLVELEAWIARVLKYFKMYPKYLGDFMDFTHSFLFALIPPEASRGLIDQEYTLPAVKSAAMGSRKLYDQMFQALGVNPVVVKALEELISVDFQNADVLRRDFFAIQSRYDMFLERYCSQPKAKDAASTREDAQQLFEIRKQYLHVSLDLYIALSRLQQKLNSVMVETSFQFWKDCPESAMADANVSEFAKTTFNIKAWCSMSEKVSSLLESKFRDARDQTEKSTILQFTPSSKLQDYDSASIQESHLVQANHKVYEKHGWLFLKKGIAWVRRWAFLKSGIFGFLQVSEDGFSVKESDKIGVLLCTVGYAAQEVRRFCIEIRTESAPPVILQVETLRELEAWLSVFHLEQKRCQQENDKAALQRYPPLMEEFASVDSHLFGKKGSQDQSFSQVFETAFSEYAVLSEDPGEIVGSLQLNTPISTSQSKAATVSRGVLASTVVPTAVTANVWGSVNWGIYYILGGPQDFITPPPTSGASSSLLKYPSYYPLHLKPCDMQLRALFETLVQRDEFVMLEFRSIWCPNPQQQLSGRCFVTQNCIFFYMNTMGFVSLLRRPLQNIVNVESFQQEKYDLLKMHLINGYTFQAKVLLGSGAAIRDKMRLLIHATPDQSLETIINKMANVAENTAETSPSLVGASPLAPADTPVQFAHFSQIYGRTHSLPAKCLFHMLAGDKSFVLQKMVPLFDLKDENAKCSLWESVDQSNKLYRLVHATLSTPSFKGKKKGVVTQSLEKIIDQKYYCIDVHSPPIRLFSCKSVSVHLRVVVYGLNADSCQLFVFFKDMPTTIVPAFLKADCIIRTSFLDADVRHAISRMGRRAKIIRAVELYGQLSTVNNPSNSQEQTGTEQQYFKEKLQLMHRTPIDVTPSMVVRFAVVKVLSAVWSVVAFILNFLIVFLRSLTFNKLLVVALGISVAVNFFFLTYNASSYWSYRRVESFLEAHSSSHEQLMQRAIYSQDVADMVNFGYGVVHSNESVCFDEFRCNSFVLNFNESKPVTHGQYPDPRLFDVVSGLKKTFNEIGIERNELLTRLRILKGVEEQLALSEWRNWVFSEVQKCQAAIDMLVVDDGDWSKLLNYCSSCEREKSYDFDAL